MTITAILMCFAGFVLHFLSRYGAHRRGGAQVSPYAYVMQDWPGWASAALSVTVAIVALPEIGPSLLGLSGEPTPGVALLVGYTGSSLASKIPGPKP